MKTSSSIHCLFSGKTKSFSDVIPIEKKKKKYCIICKTEINKGFICKSDKCMEDGKEEIERRQRLKLICLNRKKEK